MTYKNPENFDHVFVEGKRLPMGEEGPWNVVGTVTTWEDFGEKVERTVIKGPFRTSQVAQAWLDVYLEMYVKDRYFDQYIEGWLFEPLDESKTAR
ncbi:hypothetical protein SEA_CURSIVE_199 [Streptomyces phage Cursive]